MWSRFLPACLFLNKSVPSVHLSQSCINTACVGDYMWERFKKAELQGSRTIPALENSLKCGENAKVESFCCRGSRIVPQQSRISGLYQNQGLNTQRLVSLAVKMKTHLILWVLMMSVMTWHWVCALGMLAKVCVCVSVFPAGASCFLLFSLVYKKVSVGGWVSGWDSGSTDHGTFYVVFSTKV